ncbi:MAG: hypothetical protein L3J29_11715 [Cyclobacteriaceae bacterium]|nr:hypothetical protein [Cyclobacteriaceae bacterium]
MKAILQNTTILLFLIFPFLQSCSSSKNQEQEDKSKVETIKSIAEQNAIDDMVQRYKEELGDKPQEATTTTIDRSHLSEIEQSYYAAGILIKAMI